MVQAANMDLDADAVDAVISSMRRCSWSRRLLLLLLLLLLFAAADDDADDADADVDGVSRIDYDDAVVAAAFILTFPPQRFAVARARYVQRAIACC